MRDIKKEQGITLIALVVTLVILIILAAVSINMVLGDQGIFKKAQQAANAMHDAEVNTQVSFNSITDEMDKIIQGSNTENPELKQDTPNAPEQIEGMTPIKFIEPTDSQMGSYEETNWSDDSWYDYSQKNGQIQKVKMEACGYGYQGMHIKLLTLIQKINQKVE